MLFSLVQICSLCTCWEESEKRSPRWKGILKEKRVFLHLVCVFASTTSAETCNKLCPMHVWILGFAAITFLLPWLQAYKLFVDEKKLSAFSFFCQ
jgi:hypothetical protein